MASTKGVPVVVHLLQGVRPRPGFGYTTRRTARPSVPMLTRLKADFDGVRHGQTPPPLSWWRATDMLVGAKKVLARLYHEHTKSKLYTPLNLGDRTFMPDKAMNPRWHSSGPRMLPGLTPGSGRPAQSRHECLGTKFGVGRGAVCT